MERVKDGARLGRGQRGGGGGGGGDGGEHGGGGGEGGLRTPPHSLEAEQAVLGSILLDNEALDLVLEFLENDDFYGEVNRQLFEAMKALYADGQPIDTTTLYARLHQSRAMHSVGGVHYLLQLTDRVPSATSARHYAQIVAEKSTLRKLIRITSEAQEGAYTEVENVTEYVNDLERQVFGLARADAKQAFFSMREVIKTTFIQIENLYEKKEAVTGVTTGYLDLDEMTAGWQPSDMIILAARPSMGKCLTANTLIVDPDTGARRTIEDCVRERMPRVLGLDALGRVRPTPIGDWIDSGVKPAFRVRTRLGREVEVTGHHPFLTIDGWRPLHELTPGDSIAVPRTVPAFGARVRAHDEVRLMAYFVAEGNLTQSIPRFTNTDPEIVADFEAAIARLFPQCKVRWNGIDARISKHDGKRGPAHPNPLTAWLRGLGLWGKYADAKGFPECVWQLDRAGLCQFLRALFSCDGTIYRLAEYPRIELCVASPTLAADVQHALTRLGIVSKRWQKKARAWRVDITDGASVERFQQQVGWIGEKRDRFPVQSGHRHCAKFGNPPSAAWSFVRRAAAARGWSLCELARQAGETEARGKRGGYNAHTRRAIARERLAGYAEVLDDDALRWRSSEDILWDVISDIEPLGEVQVYDLTVPDGANFVAADVCVHNTALSLNFVANAAVHAGIPTAFFSLEMSKEQLAMRLLCCEARIDASRLRSGFLTDAEWTRLVKAAGALSESPIYIDDTPALPIMKMQAKVRRLKAERGLGLIVVDYLQLMKGDPKASSREQEIADISRNLKATAKELDVPVISLSQLNRGVDSRTDKRPLLSDLRESGSIEQDADIIMFIYRDEVYNKETTEKGIAEVIIAKQRNGAIGTVKLKWFGMYTRFENLARDEASTPFG